MQYSYEITTRPAELGGGWKLRLLEESEEVGGGVFPVAPVDPYQGMTWWNTLMEDERGYWLKVANSARPADAYHAFLLAEAYANAESEAYAWLDSREEQPRFLGGGGGGGGRT
jgi:hypothetical protein